MNLHIHLHHESDEINDKLDAILTLLTQFQEKAMSAFTTLSAAQAQEHTDLAALTTLIPQLLAAFASGALTPAQASTLLTEMNSEDATIQTNITSIQAVLPPPTPTGASAVKS